MDRLLAQNKFEGVSGGEARAMESHHKHLLTSPAPLTLVIHTRGNEDITFVQIRKHFLIISVPDSN